MTYRRRFTALAAAVIALLVGTAVAGPSMAGAASAGVAAARSSSAERTLPLTNLAHLDWLGGQVSPPAQPGHTTYLIDQQPSIDVLWTYAEPDPAAGGAYKQVGGGKYDAATNTWGQGAFNADDMTRAAVVYLRHWKLTGSTSSRTAAYGMLRGLTYLQTVTGPNTGNVVLQAEHDSRPPRDAQTVGQRRVLLAGAHDLGAR